MKKSKTAVNTVANLASRAWTMVANYLFVPIYISILGEEAYGLITFFATLQTALNLLGLGLSKTLRREFAADESSGKDTLYKYRIMRSVELIYFGIAILICGICFFGAGFIAEKYLVVDQIPLSTVVNTVRLMGVSIAAQLLANLYLGCLFGQERQVLADTIQIIWSVLKNVGVVLVVLNISSEISSFYLWHVLVDIAYLVVLREIVVFSLKKKAKLSWSIDDFSNIKGVLRFAVGVMIISIGYTVNTQADKMIISGNFPLTIVGAYNSSYNLGFAASIFVAAMGIAVFPRFTNYFTAGRIEDQKKEFIRSNRIANIVTVSIGTFVAVFSYELLLLWTRSETIADTMRIAALPLIIGTTFNALQEIPYNYFLASGVTIVNNIQTVCSIGYVLVITPLMIKNYGILGASLAWFIQMTLFTMVYLFIFYFKFFKGEVLKRIAIDTLLPMAISFGIAMGLHSLLRMFELSNLITVLIAITVGFLTMCELLISYCRNDVLRIIKKNKM